MEIFNHHNTLRKLVFGLALLCVAFMASGQSERMAKVSNDDEKIKVEVFPNPTSDYLTIDLSNLELVKPKIEIRSIIGTKMRVNLEKNGLKKYKVDVQSFQRGYYLVLVMDDQSKFQQTVRFSKK
ncbi:T9SS type A sorting domain-containing protein [Roseivirga sp. E12]|uniref:T9SS type A sorting domain-containing protein n=1 Tax=Roseivirga sp. E12 TaxID=2819237 RepID=UPI001ABC5075|nr:T9SS type A sorting domain-containing protein [Roseivirga sp. E12]MBO3700781.1 T9SS type A sorting domain-containing protein [Roseivirga sp. E12]